MLLELIPSFFFLSTMGPQTKRASLVPQAARCQKTNTGVDDAYLKERGVNIQRGAVLGGHPRASKRRDAIRTGRDALRPARKTQPNKLPAVFPPPLFFFFLRRTRRPTSGGGHTR